MTAETSGEFVHSFGLGDEHRRGLSAIYGFARKDQRSDEEQIPDDHHTLPFYNDANDPESSAAKLCDIHGADGEILRAVYVRKSATSEIKLILFRLDEDQNTIDALSFEVPHEFQPNWQVHLAGTVNGVDYYPNDPRDHFGELMTSAKALIEDYNEHMTVHAEKIDSQLVRTTLSDTSEVCLDAIEGWLEYYANQNSLRAPGNGGAGLSVKRRVGDMSLELHYYQFNDTLRMELHFFTRDDEHHDGEVLTGMVAEKNSTGTWQGLGDLVIEDECYRPNDNEPDKISEVFDSITATVMRNLIQE